MCEFDFSNPMGWAAGLVVVDYVHSGNCCSLRALQLHVFPGAGNCLRASVVVDPQPEIVIMRREHGQPAASHVGTGC